MIPVLLLKNGGLVKTVKFQDETYVGDPINAVRIFNEKEVDELVVLDIIASKQSTRPDLRKIEEIVSECFMPICYGGGVQDTDDMRSILALGVEKIAINSSLYRDDLDLLADGSQEFGSQSIVASIDVKTGLFGRHFVYSHQTDKSTGIDPVDFAREVEKAGAGEILLNSVNLDGTFRGYDLDLVRSVAAAVSIPVVACGGAGSLDDLRLVVEAGKASAAAAGSIFVFHGKHRAVLISYPSAVELERVMATY